MTRKIALTPKARADLSGLWRASRERWGVDQADAYVAEMNRHFLAIAAKPMLGRVLAAIDEKYRCFTSGTHVIVYRYDDDTLIVVRILHTRMDFTRHL